ncbi:MAG: zinc-ribbon domain-containing protein [Sporolactobacillus sp.]
MKEYRENIKEHFESRTPLHSLLSLDAVFYGVGLLFLFLTGFSLLRVPTDLFSALGFWLFWFGIVLAFIRKGDISLTIGLGIYALLNFIQFINACATSSYGFFGFTTLLNTAVDALLLVLTIRDADFYKDYQARQRTAVQYQAQYSSEPEPIQSTDTDTGSQFPAWCPNCGSAVDQNTKFCPHCGQKMPEANRCPKCGSPIPAGSRVCIVCGADTEKAADHAENSTPAYAAVSSEPASQAEPAPADQAPVAPASNELAVEQPAPAPKKQFCTKCGAELNGATKFCTKCGAKL